MLLNTLMGTESFRGKAQLQGGHIHILVNYNYGKEEKLKLASTCQYGYCITEQDINKGRNGAASKTHWEPDNSNKIPFSTASGLLFCTLSCNEL